MNIPTFDPSISDVSISNARPIGGGNGSNGRKSGERKKLEDIYEVGDILGKGGFGVVRKCRNLETGVYYAVKMIDKAKAGAAGMSEIFSEVEIVSLLSHRYIIALQDVFETKEALCLVMELLLGGELEVRLKKQGHFSEGTTRRLTRNVLLAVEYIHRKGIVHRDLKPANMLLAYDSENSEVKLADFGFALLIGNDSCLSAVCGTTAYMAPEILAGENYGKAVDMWSMGVIVYHLLSGLYPFTGATNEELTNNIVNGHYHIPDDGPWTDVSNGAKDLIRRLLVVDPRKRITAIECLNHSWVRIGADEDMDLLMQVLPGGMPSDDEDDEDDGDLYPVTSNSKLSVSGSGSGVGGGGGGGRKHHHHHYGRNVLSGRQKFRAGVFVVQAHHRLIYWHRCHAIRRMGIECPFMYHLGNVLYRVFDCREIDCNTIPIGNRGLNFLLDMVSNSPSVEALYLANNDLSYDSIQNIVKCASNHPSLTTLDLSCNPITQTGARALLRLARTNHRIKFIGLKGTQLNTEVITQINAALAENSKRRLAHRESPSPVMASRFPSPLPGMNVSYGLTSATSTASPSSLLPVSTSSAHHAGRAVSPMMVNGSSALNNGNNGSNGQPSQLSQPAQSFSANRVGSLGGGMFGTTSGGGLGESLPAVTRTRNVVGVGMGSNLTGQSGRLNRFL